MMITVRASAALFRILEISTKGYDSDKHSTILCRSAPVAHSQPRSKADRDCGGGYYARLYDAQPFAQIPSFAPQSIIPHAAEIGTRGVCHRGLLRRRRTTRRSPIWKLFSISEVEHTLIFWESRVLFDAPNSRQGLEGSPKVHISKVHVWFLDALTSASACSRP